MANGDDGPTGEMTATLWNSIKTKTWYNGGWKDGSKTLYLHPCANGTSFKAWFKLSSSAPKLLQLYMDKSVFDKLKTWTFSSQAKAWIYGNYKYRLRWEYKYGKWKVFYFKV